MGLSFYQSSFSVEAIKKYKLSLTELAVLDWLLQNMFTKLECEYRKSKGVFFWVDYQKIIDELSWIRTDHPYSTASMRILFQKLFKKRILNRWLTSVEGKPRVYCQFNDPVIYELAGYGPKPTSDRA